MRRCKDNDVTSEMDENEMRRNTKKFIIQLYTGIKNKSHSLNKSGAGTGCICKWLAYNYFSFFRQEKKKCFCAVMENPVIAA
jgi:hypothetical protein